jgi:hypothetical protein
VCRCVRCVGWEAGYWILTYTVHIHSFRKLKYSFSLHTTWITNFDPYASLSVIRSCTNNTKRGSVTDPNCLSYATSQFKLTTQFCPCHRRTTVSVCDTIRCCEHMLTFKTEDGGTQQVPSKCSNPSTKLRCTTRWNPVPSDVLCRIITWHRISTRQASWPLPMSLTFHEYPY